jgi:transcriptional regulator with XRE-family HTH domain
MDQPIVSSLGKRIKDLRLRRKWTLRKLSEVSNLSANAISLIERGENSPTVSSLHRLAMAFEIPIVEFFQEEQDNFCVFVEKGKGMRIQNADVELESLGFGLPHQQLEPFRMVIAPGMKTSSGLISHPGQEFVYCLEGEIEYQVEDECYQLKPGESLLLDASHPHGWHNPTKKPATILLIFQASQDRHLARQLHLAMET